MRFWPLTTNERAENGMTHACEVTADDLTMATVNTLQTLSTLNGGPIFTFAIGDVVKRIFTNLKVPFQNTADAAFNSDTMSVGDSVGGVATILTPAIEVNANGAFVTNKPLIPTGTPATGFTAATNLTITFNSMAAKALLSLNKGNIVIFLNIERLGPLEAAIAAAPIITK